MRAEPVFNLNMYIKTGKPGVDGADGVIVIYWDKEAET